MKILIASFLVTLAFSVAGFGQKCTEFSVPNSSFAFCAPAGWVRKADAKSKSVSFEAPEAPDKLGSVLVVDHDTVPTTRDSFAYQLIQGELKAEGYSNTRLVAARDIETTSGVKGTMLIFFLEMKDLPFVQGFYIFDGPNNGKLTFTVTGQQEDKELAKIIDASMKTVRLKK